MSNQSIPLCTFSKIKRLVMDFWHSYAIENQQKYLYNNNGIIYMIINLHLITEKVINTENDYLTKKKLSLHNFLCLTTSKKETSQKSSYMLPAHKTRISNKIFLRENAAKIRIMLRETYFLS